MTKLKAIILTLVLALFLFVPMLLIAWYSSKDKYYDEVLSTYECPVDTCAADFDSDGFSERVILNRAFTDSASNSLSVIKANGQELLRLPHRHIDNTLRTHIAIRNVSGRNHLIIYDRIEGGDAGANGVFVWLGNKMGQVSPSGEDVEVLRAMEARDDTGSFSKWVMFRVIKGPALFCYYLLIGVLLWNFRSRVFG